ncbi:MAG TPA: hypothetical protein VGV13_14330 [Methylomirabilota bacterium]|jgi:hypothetical protein|nr:hypothetical protein [Methylomirabilota bacterium]
MKKFTRTAAALAATLALTGTVWAATITQPKPPPHGPVIVRPAPHPPVVVPAPRPRR